MQIQSAFKSISAVVLLLSVARMPAHAEKWDTSNDPSAMDFNHNYNYHFSELPLKAGIATPPWSETYWPSYRGGINRRWNTPDQDGFKYTPLTQAEAKAASQDALKTLSPSEKYDLAQGHYNYPLYNEAKEFADPSADPYTGLCDGWTIAAVQYAEPGPITITNPDGIAIPFGSSDVKALMTYAAEFHFDRDVAMVGNPCEYTPPAPTSPTTPSSPTNPVPVPIPMQSAACADINAGAMHVVLANEIGLKNNPFMTDRQPDPELWDQPVYGYESSVTGSATSNVPGATAVQVHTVLYYSEDLDQPHWDKVAGTPNFHFNRIRMDYVLDIDANGNIVGGSYIANSDHPDYFWNLRNRLTFSGKMAGVNALLANSSSTGRTASKK